MAELCLRTGRLAEARICLEEVALVLDPENVASIVKLADVSRSRSLFDTLLSYCTAYKRRFGAL